ncbi:MAG: MmgE/PrpD family protein [Desulfarculaceae bacterium]|nr:MmgE/PrpD family protein [Desulfarculaceae bacterium]
MSDQSGASLTEALIDFCADTGWEQVPTEAREYAKLLIMDTLGVALPGRLAPGCPGVAELAGRWGGEPLSSLLFSGRKISPPLAALANSTMMHALDFDDTLDASALHCMVSVLPAALAVAEAEGPIDGQRFITAIALGVDMICRLSLAINTPLSWIRTATCGSFGAATTAAKLLGLDRDGLANALGVVYAMTSGNAQGLIEGRLVKRMQPAFAAQAGVEAAYLAQAGITGSRDFLEGPYGFYNLYEKGRYDPAPVLEGLGSRFMISELSLKPYPCCRMTHSAIGAALELEPLLEGRAGEITSIAVSASSMVAEMVGKPLVLGDNPQVDAQFSIPYTVSAALLRGDVFLGDFEVDSINDPAVLELAAKVKVTADPIVPAKDLMRAALSVQLKGGESLESLVEAPLGNPAKPMDLALCKEKFAKCLAYSGLAMSGEQSEALLAFIEGLDQAPDAGAMAGMLGA